MTRPAPSRVTEPRPDIRIDRPKAAPGHSQNGAVNGHVHTPVREDRLLEVDWTEALPAHAASTSWKIRRGVKAIADRTLALVGILLLSPLLIAVALLVKLTSPGPVFYTCDYVGYRGRRFRGYKFRTMVRNAEALKAELEHLNHMTGPAFKIRKDPRVTPIGAFLRKYSIDELPQLWNVLRGDMSLVGPRPPLPEEWEEFEPWQRLKLSVIPGITCYWQVRGRSEITAFDTWARMDLQYIREWSLWTDVKVLLATIPAVLRGHGAY